MCPWPLAVGRCGRRLKKRRGRASPERSPNVAAYSFRVVGPTIEELWNHYAVLCGMKQRYGGKTFQIIGDTGPNGSYVVADHWTGNGQNGRGVSVFLLKTESYTVTAIFQPDSDGRLPVCRKWLD